MKAKFLLLLVSATALVSCGGGGNATETVTASVTSSVASSTTTEGSQATEESQVSDGRRPVEWTNPFADTATEEVTLTVWGGESQTSVDFINTVAADFKKANPRSNYTINVKPVSESSVSGDWESDPANAADLAIAADDQIPSMVSSGRLVDLNALDAKKIPGILDYVVNNNLEESIEVLTHGDKVYGFPVSASNGFVLYYNAKYINAEQAKTFDGLLAAIHAASETAGRNLTFGYPYNSGWYLDGWFHGAGFTATGEAGALSVECNWNETLKGDGTEGKDVAGAMVKLAHGQYKQHWSAGKSEDLLARISDDSTNQVVATISGTWDYNRLVKTWGEENAKAAVLPSYHLDLANKDVQMHSVKGFKVAIVNKSRKNAVAAARFAEFLANYQSQVLRYDMLNEAPASKNARALVMDENVNPVVKAINDQWNTSFVEKVNPTFWHPTNGLSVQLSAANNDTAKFVTSGEGTKEVVLNYEEIQKALDNCVDALSAK